MENFDTFDENGVFLSSEDETDVHYKGLWHKVVRVWLYDNEGNIYLRILKNNKKLDCINEIHMRSSESVSSCFDRGMFEKLGIHFPATSNFEQVSTKKVKVHRVYSDNSELKDNYFLCDYIGEFDKGTNFFIFSSDTEGLLKTNAKGILGILKNRTGEVVAYQVLPGNNESEEKTFVKIENIFNNPNEDTYQKYASVINAIIKNAQEYERKMREEKQMQKLAKRKAEEKSEFVSHAEENEGTEIY